MEQKLSNPTPLGLMGFGMTTVLLNIHNAGFFPISVMILSMGIFYGGMAQIIAGILEFRKGNTFGNTALIFTRIAGWEGIACGLSAIYLAMAEVLNENLGRTVLPIGPF